MKSGNVLSRSVVAGVALLLAAWLAVGLRSTILEERGRDQLTSGLTLRGATQARIVSRAARNLDRASWLNPDRIPRMYYAQSIVILGDKVRAEEVTREVIRAEPENLENWRTALGVGLALPDRGLQAEARRRIRELNPRTARSR